MANMIELDAIPENISEALHVPREEIFPGQTWHKFSREG